eukprot:g3299.t1
MTTSSDEDRSSRRSREKRKHRSRDKRRKRSSEKSMERRRDKSEEKRRKLDKHEHSRSRESGRRSSRHRERRRYESRSRNSNPTPEPAPVSETETTEERNQRRKEEEQLLLDQEMEKRRERVRKWQQKRREALEKTEQELDAREKANENKKKWSLEDDEDDDDMAHPEPEANGHAMEAEVDPLEMFMEQEILPRMQVDVKKALFMEEKEEQNAIKDIQTDDPRSVHVPNSKPEKKKEFDPYDSDASDFWRIEEEEDDEDDDEWFKRLQAGRLSKGDKLAPIDHSNFVYESFRKNLYIEVREITKMTEQDVKAYRKEIDGIKVRGKDIPKPIKTWSQSGLSEKMVEVMKKSGFLAPLPIQAQALPVIMSGRDCIGIAKTGSGKTLAFVLPMLRHIKDQRPVLSAEGPIGLIMAPTRELVQQIGKEIKHFSKFLEVTCVCVYGGSGVANQINELKRGAEIVVCTPGRMIDLLVTSNGKITNLRRVTFLVMDEADRMFDMGFEPQITRIVSNIRPDRQTVMFSATFPRPVEMLARKLLTEPVEILVGGRSVVNKDITQFVEIRPVEDRLLRTLEILGQWHDKGKVLVFVNSQESCDCLFRDLIRQGYPCLSLHGGKDQTDRECTISDFKGEVCNLMVATSVAARGLDVRDLVLVLNYEVPNHHEDYVHRVGRTGRAGNKGTAITFISSDEDKYAPDLVKALKESQAPIPQDLQQLSDQFTAKKNKGLAIAHGSGYGGSGFKFDEHEEDERKAVRKAQQREFRMDEESDSDDEAGFNRMQSALQNAASSSGNGGASTDIKNLPQVQAAHQLAAKLAAQAAHGSLVSAGGYGNASTQVFGTPGLAAVQAAVQQQQQMQEQSLENPILAAAKAAAGQIAAKAGVSSGVTPASMPLSGSNLMISNLGKHFEAELEINDFPQHARWKITHRDTLAAINELTGAAVTTRGLYIKPGSGIPLGERKLFLLIEGFTESSVKKAKSELKKILAETTEKVMRRDGPSTGKYSVL